jgi:ABC-type Fe3+ transport system permease subunit
MLPAFRGLDPSYDEGARILGLSQSARFWKIRLPLLRGPLLVAITFTLAMSLGEFGASWVVARSGEWDTLPVLIDSLRSRTGWDPLIQPTAAAAATTLMLITLLLFMTVERFRPKGEGGMF